MKFLHSLQLFFAHWRYIIAATAVIKALMKRAGKNFLCRVQTTGVSRMEGSLIATISSSLYKTMVFTVGVAVRSTTASVTLTRRGSQTTSSGFYFRRENWRKTRGARKEHPRVFLEKKPEELKNIILRFFFTEELKERLYSILEL